MGDKILMGTKTICMNIFCSRGHLTKEIHKNKMFIEVIFCFNSCFMHLLFIGYILTEMTVKSFPKLYFLLKFMFLAFTFNSYVPIEMGVKLFLHTLYRSSYIKVNFVNQHLHKLELITTVLYTKQAVCIYKC